MEAGEAYLRGHRAALRIEEYEGWKKVPPNPYEPGTPDHEQWDVGFGDGTEDLIAWNRSDS
jgi:hypothetical protein